MRMLRRLGTRRGGLGLTAAAILTVLAAAAPGRVVQAEELPPAERPIQPGARVWSVAGGEDIQCTLNFVFADPQGRLYIGTAGHCTDAVGQRVRTDNGEFGSVVYRRFDSGPIDFALIQVFSSLHGAVSPAVRFWGGPTGFTRASETIAGDPLTLHGYGVAFGTTLATRPRAGALVSDGSSTYTADTLAVFGDSGGPLLHARTGKALGTIAAFNLNGFPPTTDTGPTVEGLLSILAQAGFDLTLQTAPLASGQ